MQETQAQSLGQEDPLEEEVTMHASIFACKIPGTEEPGNRLWGCKESDTTEQLHSNYYHCAEISILTLPGNQGAVFTPTTGTCTGTVGTGTMGWEGTH